MENIRDRYRKCQGYVGSTNEITLADGSRIRGFYHLIEAGDVTASHDPFHGWVKSPGFPTDKNGNTVNDRDYERDREAQQTTEHIAEHYDQRALQTAVVVTHDGIVLSGNGRTMAGDLAASWGTDTDYIDYLRKYPQQFGFTENVVRTMVHPRVVFELIQTPPYTTETFARFNAQEMKSMSKTEQAVKMGKLVTDELFHRVCQAINEFESLAEFYADARAALDVVHDLVTEGVLSQMQMASMMDGDRLSDTAQEVIENILIGKAFAVNPDAVREITSVRSMRKVIVTALAEVANSICLGNEYSLEREMAAAIHLVYTARRTGGYREGDRVSQFARQTTMFGDAETVADQTDGAMLLLSDLLNDKRCTRLKKVLAIYNHHAHESACGQTDIFAGGGVKTKAGILSDVYQMLGCEAEIKELVSAAVAARISHPSPITSHPSPLNPQPSSSPIAHATSSQAAVPSASPEGSSLTSQPTFADLLRKVLLAA